MAGKKISDFTDGGAFIAGDKVLIARGSNNHWIDGEMVPTAEVAFTGSYNDLLDLPAPVQGFSGAYADLTGKPTIPTKTSELINDSGFGTGGGGGAVGPYPIQPATAAILPLEFKSGASTGTMIENPRGLVMRRTDRGNQYTDSNFERMQAIDPTKPFTLDTIIRRPTLNRGAYCRYGLALRESGTDKHLYWYFATESSSPQLARLNANNIGGAGASFANLKAWTWEDVWLRVVATATEYELWYSDDYGLTFRKAVSYPKTTYFTVAADQVGLIMQAYGSFSDDMDLVSVYYNYKATDA